MCRARVFAFYEAEHTRAESNPHCIGFIPDIVSRVSRGRSGDSGAADGSSPSPVHDAPLRTRGYSQNSRNCHRSDVDSDRGDCHADASQYCVAVRVRWSSAAAVTMDMAGPGYEHVMCL